MEAFPPEDEADGRSFALLRETTDFTALFNLEKIANEQREDHFCRAVLQALRGDDSGVSSLPPRLRQLLKADQLFIDGDLILLQGDRLLVPVHLRGRMLHYFHCSRLGGGHRGHAATHRAMKQCTYWPGMREDTRLFVLGCPECQKGKSDWRVNRQGLRVQMAVSAPNELVHVDSFELPESTRGNKFGMVMIDHFSGFLEIAVMPAIGGYNMSMAFMTQWICHYGIPRRLHSDRGTEYLNETSDRLAHLCGFRLDFASGWSPQANGKAENAVKYVKAALRMRIVDGPWQQPMLTKKLSVWDELMPLIAMEKNSAISPTHGFTPYEAFHGRPIRKPHELALQLSKERTKPKTPAEIRDGKKTVGDFVDTLKLAYSRIHATAKEHLADHRKRVQKHLDKGRTPHKFKVGDKALVRVEGLVGTAKKLTPPYIGPFLVKQVGGNGTTITLDGGRNAGRAIHVQKCRKWIERQPLQLRKPGRPRKKSTKAKKKKKPHRKGRGKKKRATSEKL